MVPLLGLEYLHSIDRGISLVVSFSMIALGVHTGRTWAAILLCIPSLDEKPLLKQVSPPAPLDSPLLLLVIMFTLGDYDFVDGVCSACVLIFLGGSHFGNHRGQKIQYLSNESVNWDRNIYSPCRRRIKRTGTTVNKRAHITVLDRLHRGYKMGIIRGIYSLTRFL